MPNLSPMMQQYLAVKAQHKNEVLFFRIGDFYEMFFDDAVKISKELELTLTGKDCGLPERAPMCGIPYHAADTYIKRLMDKGYKVAICEQMEDPSLAKGLVKRDIVRIVTPGTVIEKDFLNDDRNNFIASVIVKDDTFSACFADISTGDVFLTEQYAKSSLSASLIAELSKFMPSEILYNEEMVSYKEVGTFIKDKLSCVCEELDDAGTDYYSCMKTVLTHFAGQTLEKMQLSDKELSVIALGSLLSYVNSTQKQGALRIKNVTIYQESQYMSIDLTARRNLEITETLRSGEKKGTLLWVLDQTQTAMGKRFMRKALEQPLLNLAEITHRQSAVSELCQNGELREKISHSLTGVYDMERLMTRVMYGTVSPREVKSISFTLSRLPELKSLMGQCRCAFLQNICRDIDPLKEVHDLIESAIAEEPPALLKDGGVIKKGYNQELDGYRDLCGNAKTYIAKIEAREKEKTGIRNLKIGYNRVFGYYIEVTKSNLSMVPESYIRKQTLVNCERYITQELKDLEGKVLSANDKILGLEYELFTDVRRKIADCLDPFQRTAAAIARLDFVLSLANVAYENNYVCPTITDDGVIDIKDGRHPVVERMLKDSLFVPNDTLLDLRDNKIMILTGPNMAGKSTYMRQVALFVIMAQIGSFVPASSASIGVCDKIFTRVGASDDLSSGQSTFMVEMSEVAHILKNATPKSLVILDEIGRGTSTFDGMSIAKAVIMYLSQNKRISCKTLFATHYHELTALEGELAGVKNYNIAVKKRGEEITFLRKIVRGGADESYGIDVARLAGVPKEVLQNAQKYLSELNSSGAPLKAVEKPPEEKTSQLSFSQSDAEQLKEQLARLPVDTLTPIEALNKLYELKKLISH